MRGRKAPSLARDLATAPPEVDGTPIPPSASFGLAADDGTEDQEVRLASRR
jgi:hypothetical protein